MIKLDILSDPICPWCYIGKTQMDRALSAVGEHPFVIEWHPFQLNPGMPREGMDRRTYLEAKFGGKQAAAQVYGRIAEAAEAVGLMINFGAIERTPNTLDAHRLIHWAGIEAKQGPVVDALFAAYFEQGRDIGTKEVLVEIAEANGLDAQAVGKLLDGDADREELAARDAHSRGRGVTGVPTFVIANQHVLPGAQPTEVWSNVLTDIQSQLEAASADGPA